jgi:transcriptional regulator with XRE-family HTH domain
VLTPDERIRVGRQLQRLRENQDLNQEDIREKTGLAVGTVQAIEYNKHKVGIENIEKYAVAVGTTIQQLLHPEAVPPPNELVRDLNAEHLDIARRYMKAFNSVREAVEVLLADETTPGIVSDMADVVLALKRASDLEREIAFWTESFLLDRADLLVDLAQRLNADPTFEEVLRDLLDDVKGKPK